MASEKKEKVSPHTLRTFLTILPLLPSQQEEGFIDLFFYSMLVYLKPDTQ